MDSTRHEIVVVTGEFLLLGPPLVSMAVKLRGAPLAAPVLLSAELFTEAAFPFPAPLMAKRIRNGDQVDLNVNTCWLKWRPFVSLGSGGGVL